MVTGNELFPALVSAPLKVAAPLTVKFPGIGTLTFTVTTIVWPTAILLAPQLMREQDRIVFTKGLQMQMARLLFMVTGPGGGDWPRIQHRTTTTLR